MFVILPKWLFMKVPSELANHSNEYCESEIVSLFLLAIIQLFPLIILHLALQLSFGEITHETSHNLLLDSNKLNGSLGEGLTACSNPLEMPNGNVTLSTKVDMIRRQINHIQQLIMEQDRNFEPPDEWEWMANVLERLFLITFIILCLLISGSILLIGWLATM